MLGTNMLDTVRPSSIFVTMLSKVHTTERPTGLDRPHTLKEMARITAGAVTSLVVVGWMAVIAIAVLSVLMK
jgi:hypothetical protein